MIGKLLQTAAAPFSGSANRSFQAPLESIQEEVHTRNLLFPDPSTLKNTQQFDSTPSITRNQPTAKEAGGYDNRGGLDGIKQDDIRIIIAQDTCGRWQSPQILFDTKRDESKQSPKREDDPAKRQSLTAKGKSMTSPPATARRGHTPNSSIFTRPTPSSPTITSPESRGLFGPPRFSRQQANDPFVDAEIRDGKDDIDSLLNCMFGAAGFKLHAGTKLHILPGKPPKLSAVQARPSSSGGGQRRLTPLSRSTSMADWEDSTPNEDSRIASSKASIMITRLFSVSLVEDGSLCAHQRPSMSMEQRKQEDLGETDKNVKQKKVPMYAISIIVHLPDDTGSRFKHGTSEALFTPTPSPRRGDGYFSLQETRNMPIFDQILRYQTNYVLSHWTMLNRNIEILEHVASHILRHILQSVPSAPRLDPPPKGTAKSKPAKQQTQQLIYVPPDCLQFDRAVKSESETVAKMVATALRTKKVVVGQDRWGAWREEARWISRWAASKEQKPFFYHILTSFLGNHDIWLQSVHVSHRRRASYHHRASGIEPVSSRNRTVIVANDKMAARRLIFLLSHFFPSSTGQNLLQAPFSLSQSFSDVPPSFSLTKERDLRRTINSKPRSSLKDSANHNRSVSFSLVEYERQAHEEPVYENKSRRGSETRSIRSLSNHLVSQDPTDANIPRKSSVSTVLAESDVPIPHFSSFEEQAPTPRSPRPSSGGSMASLALSQTLKRRESSNPSSSGVWGSIVSGFWSNRRDSSTSDQDVISSVKSSPVKPQMLGDSLQTGSRLDQMVDEVSSMPSPRFSDLFAVTPNNLRNVGGLPTRREAPRDIPESKTLQKPEHMPLSISLNEDEGYLDISLSPGHSFQSSLASSYASIRFGTNSPCDHSSMLSSFASDASRNSSGFSINAAGWLKAFHPNFALQAVRPYENLESEMKEAMQAEASITPTPIEVDVGQSGRWVDICSTLVVDTTNFSMRKLRLCRRRKLGLQPEHSYEDKLFVDTVSDVDSTLIDVIRRVLAVSSGSSRSPSRAHSPRPHPSASASRAYSRPPSRPASIRGRTSTSFPDGRPMAADAPHFETRRMIIGALEDIVRSVKEERSLSSTEAKESHSHKEENSLRENIRKWLNSLDGY